MQIFVRNFTGKTIALEMEPQDTIRTLRERLCDADGVPREGGVIPEACQYGPGGRIIYQGRDLEDERTLADCGLTKEAALFMVPRPRGG